MGNSHAEATRSFEQLYRGHRLDVYRAALRELGNAHDAEDVTQAAFIDAYRAVLRGTRPQAPRAWLLTIAENVRRRRFRTSLRRPREEPLDVSTALAADDAHDQAGGLIDALGSLPSAQREAFLLREISGLSYDEIAERTSSTVPAIQMLLFRARKTLREELAASDVRPALVPLPAWLATVWSRVDVGPLTPRAAGALGAAVLAVAGTGASVSAKADSRIVAPRTVPAESVVRVPARVARPAPVRRLPARTAAPARARPAAVAQPASRRRSTPASSPAPISRPAPPVEASPPLETESGAPAIAGVELPAASAAAPLLEPVLGPAVEPLLEPIAPMIEAVAGTLEDAGAAGASGADAPPLPVLPLDPLPPVP